MPAVKISARLKLDENISFPNRHYHYFLPPALTLRAFVPIIRGAGRNAV
jgi:hypothetical protein